MSATWLHFSLLLWVSLLCSVFFLRGIGLARLVRRRDHASSCSRGWVVPMTRLSWTGRECQCRIGLGWRLPLEFDLFHSPRTSQETHCRFLSVVSLISCLSCVSCLSCLISVLLLSSVCPVLFCHSSGCLSVCLCVSVCLSVPWVFQWCVQGLADQKNSFIRTLYILWSPLFPKKNARVLLKRIVKTSPCW